MKILFQKVIYVCKLSGSQEDSTKGLSTQGHREQLMDTMAVGMDEICHFMATAVSIKAV